VAAGCTCCATPTGLGTAVVTLLVDDLDERLAAAAARGIEFGPLATKAGSMRTTWTTDPDGNRVKIGQPG
jgi:hypothetical protein